MIECLPAGICSWNYFLRGDGHDARVDFNWMGEQGRLWIDNREYRIEKDGLFGGSWRMESAEGTLFHARKTSALTRTFEISGRGVQATLHAASAFGRTMVLDSGGEQSVIAPAHSFTRRASMSGTCGDFRHLRRLPPCRLRLLAHRPDLAAGRQQQQRRFLKRDAAYEAITFP